MSVMVGARTSIHAVSRVVGSGSRSQLFDGECIMKFLISSSVMFLKHVSVDSDYSSSSSSYDGIMNVFLFLSSMTAMISSILSVKKLLNTVLVLQDLCSLEEEVACYSLVGCYISFRSPWSYLYSL